MKFNFLVLELCLPQNFCHIHTDRHFPEIVKWKTRMPLFCELVDFLFFVCFWGDRCIIFFVFQVNKMSFALPMICGRTSLEGLHYSTLFHSHHEYQYSPYSYLEYMKKWKCSIYILNSIWEILFFKMSFHEWCIVPNNIKN